MPVVAVVALAIYGGALLWGAASDLARFLIPNEVSLAIVAAFALFAFALPLTTIGWHLAAGAATLVVMALAFYRGLMGGGDAKLLSALALWTGFSNVLSLFFLTALVGGVEGMVFWLLRRILAGRVPPERWYTRLLTQGEGIPYGLAISTAGLLLIPALKPALMR